MAYNDLNQGMPAFHPNWFAQQAYSPLAVPAAHFVNGIGQAQGMLAHDNGVSSMIVAELKGLSEKADEMIRLLRIIAEGSAPAHRPIDSAEASQASTVDRQVAAECGSERSETPVSVLADTRRRSMASDHTGPLDESREASVIDADTDGSPNTSVIEETHKSAAAEEKSAEAGEKHSEPTSPESPEASEPGRKPMLYKTLLCRFYTRYNSCTEGDKCNYAHGQGELRKPPADWVEHPAKHHRANSGDQRNNQRFRRNNNQSNGNGNAVGSKPTTTKLTQ